MNQTQEEINRFVNAAMDGDYKAVYDFVTKYPQLIDAWNQVDNTALASAAEYGQVAIVKFLLKKGANPNVLCLQDQTALMYAARKNPDPKYFAIARLLIDAGADVNHQDFNGSTALMEAAGSDNAYLIELLVAHGADLNAQDHQLKTALMTALETDKVEAALCLIEKGADPNISDDTGWQPLSRAIGQPAIVKALIEHKAKLDAREPNFGQTALMHAAEDYTAFETLRLLLEAGADPDLRNRQGKTALQLTEGYVILKENAALLRQWPEECRKRAAEKQRRLEKATDFSRGLSKPIPLPRSPFKQTKP